MKQFNIAYTIDDNNEQLEMLRMSIETLLKFNKVDNIFIMYFDVEENKIKQKLLDLDVNIEYFKFDISIIDETFPELPAARNAYLRYPSLSRWYISKIIPYDYFWYIDTDVLFNKNIREDFLSYQSENILFFGFNRKIYYDYINKNKNRIYIKIKGDELKNKGFFNKRDLNAGILFINSKMYNDMNLLGEVIEYYENNNRKVIFVNQSVYNYLIGKYIDRCIIQINDDINVHPIIDKPEIFERQLENVKVFHLSGKNKTNFLRLYEIIMKK